MSSQIAITLSYLSGGPSNVVGINLGATNPVVKSAVNLTPFVNLTSFAGGDNGLEAIIGFSQLTALQVLRVDGSNTLSFDISSLPSSLTEFSLRGTNTTFGNIANLKTSLLSYSNIGNNVTTGNLSDLKPTLLYYENWGNNTTTGNISALPTNMFWFSCRGQNTTTGNISSLKPALTFYSNIGNNTTTGNIANLPANLNTFLNWGNNTTTGDISALPATLTYYDNQGSNTTTGNISSLKPALTYYANTGTNTTFGNISSLKVGLTYYANLGLNTTTGNIANLPNTLTTFTNHGLNTTTGNISGLPAGLIRYKNLGSNTTTGNIALLPAGLQIYSNSGLNTVFGRVESLPSNLQLFDQRGECNVRGDIANMPRTLTDIIAAFPILGSGSTIQILISGNIDNAPPNLRSLNLDTGGKLVCNVGNLPQNIKQLILRNNNNIGLSNHEFTGTWQGAAKNITDLAIDSLAPCSMSLNIANIARNANYITIVLPNNTGLITGQLKDLPSQQIGIFGINTPSQITGNLQDVPPWAPAYFALLGSQNTITGSLTSLSAEKINALYLRSLSAITYYDGVSNGYQNIRWGSNTRFNPGTAPDAAQQLLSSMREFLLDVPSMPVAHLVTLLVDLCARPWLGSSFGIPRAITVNYAQMPTINTTTYPIALQAIQSLQSRGVTVSVKTTT